MKACITYAITTPESAENGDVSEHGWYIPHGWKYALKIDGSKQNETVLNEARNGDYDLPIKQAMKEAESLGCSEVEVCGTSIAIRTVDDHVNYSTGENTSYTLHIDCKTEKRVGWILALWNSKR